MTLKAVHDMDAKDILQSITIAGEYFYRSLKDYERLAEVGRRNKETLEKGIRAS